MGVLTPYLTDPDVTLYNGDVLAVLREMPDESVDCCITSPPYWGLRDYGAPGQLGLEPTPEEYVARMVEVFREVKRVLARHGTCWVNMGDAFDAKQLTGMPWRLAFALQADGWYLRSDIIWGKSNPMPESVTDRPTKAHEYVFLLSKQPRYFFDQEAVRERADELTRRAASFRDGGVYTGNRSRDNGADKTKLTHGDGDAAKGRNIRSVWEIATQPFPEAHFATFPEELVRRCLLAGCPEQVCGVCGKARERVVKVEYRNDTTASGRPAEGNHRHDEERVAKFASGVRTRRIPTTEGFTDCGHDAYRPGVVLDPFMGSGTVALVARKHNRRAVGIELNADYCAMAAKRLGQQSMFAVSA